MNYIQFLWTTLLIGLVTTKNSHKESSGEKECKLRDLGDGRKICVCDSKYCDTIPRPKKVDKSQFILYTSNQDGWRFHKYVGNFKKRQTTNNKGNAITINRKIKFQTILGWGGAFTDSTGINIKLLDESAQRLLMESYFSENGIEYGLCRVPIGGTDFSTKYYSYDDCEEPDHELKHFNLTMEDYEYKIPFMKMALEMRKDKGIKFFGSTWTAPKWMKTNNDYAGYGFLKNDSYQTWADYFVRFLEEYRKKGISFWGITTQNEPSLAVLGINKAIATVGWTSIALSKWIGENLGPTIKKSEFSDTKIIILDDQKLLIPWYTNSVLEGENVKQYVDGIAIHWYLGTFTPCSAMTKTHENYPDIFIVSTEACSGFQNSDGVLLGSWERGENYTTDIIEDMNCWVVGWVDWNMVLNLDGGPTFINNTVDSPIIVNATSGEFYKQPMFYHMAHHSKFVPEGSVRIDIKGNLRRKLMVAAYQRPDDGIAVVILNKHDEDMVVKVTDEFEGTAVLNITKRSINTLLYW